ncbi:MAG: hypothetical protein Q8N13_03055 [Acidovorax sp.]|nr:hypothetical protein [Acidovorax sp.]
MKSINWTLAASIGIPSVLVIAGWFFAHLLTARRELASKRRADRLRALEAAYMRIASSSNRPLTSETIERIETFVSEIQLYGTPRQVTLMSEAVKEFLKPRYKVDWDPLLADLRDTIRSELRLEAVTGSVWWLRMPVPPAKLTPHAPFKEKLRHRNNV